MFSVWLTQFGICRNDKWIIKNNDKTGFQIQY